ncbi:hypothetical protein FLONG3_2124 [Fusarium longipes]|uniref:Zn(2)-C6 fungal-type domain-containing protein n=1 Tax=Fusarium longipes TaxID=694270 RepID=A0A395T565_9HYPO|nr:hypothetical protein FLONG3_2124 [Fusarium longipes]
MSVAAIPHSMREKLLRDEVAYTMSIKLVKSIEIVGMAKTAGFDGLFIECEHSSFDLETTSQLCVAGLYAGITPIVRVPSKDPCFVSRVLDGGALGVVVPHIRSVQDAQDVVNAAKFQPIGFRSSTNGLPHHQFRSIPAKLSNPVTNDATLVIPMIETLEALELVDEIAALPGVDSLLIGTNDLTAEMGIPGDYENPRLTEAYERTLAACKKHGKWLGVGGLHARLDLVEKFCKMGARWVMAATDGPLLMGAASKRGAEMAALNESVKATAAETNGAPAKISNGVSNGVTKGTTNGTTNGAHISDSPRLSIRLVPSQFSAKSKMTTDWREIPRVSEPSPAPARTSDSPSSQPPPPRKNSLACERCFKRKQKCDRLRPACTSCADLGVECIARSQQFDFNAEDAGLTHARVNGYVESLKRRVAELEQKVKIAETNHVSRRSFGASDAILPINGKRRRSTEGYVPVVPMMEQVPPNGDEQSTVEDTMSAIGLLSNKAMAESRANTGNEPHKLAIIESISAALAIDGRDPSTASALSSHHVSMADDQPIQLTRDLTLSHIQRFIDWSVWLPYIDERRLMEQYDAVIDSHDNRDKAPLQCFNTYLAIAIGMSMSPEIGRFSALATNLHTAAAKLLPSILHSQEPLDTLHCTLLLAVFSMFNPSGGSTWHLMGFIMTNCIAAGLHKTTISQERLGEDSIYRVDWIFWSVYLIDRSLASSMGRPFGITDHYIAVSVPEAPGNDDESGLPAPVRNKLALSRHLVTHAQLISDICGGDQPSPIFSYGNLCFWREFPPPTNNTNSSCSYPPECLEQLACRAMILIVNPPTNTRTNPLLALGDSPEIETDTISSCKRLIERLYSKSTNNTAAVSFLDAYNILSAAVAYVCLVQRIPQSNQQGFAETFQVVSKASVLLTQCSTRFVAISVFQQFLLSLSTKIMEGQASLQVCASPI